MKTVAFTITLSIISAVAFAQNTFSVTVTVQDLTLKTGTIYALLTNDAANFPTPAKAEKIVAEVKKEGEMTLKFDNVQEGKYAVIIFQDLNGNKTLDNNGMMPTEPFGFSNIPSMMGPPSFEEAAFQVKENTAIKINLITY